MKYGKKVYWSIAWFVIGTALLVLSFLGVLDQFWNGFGSGLIGVGVFQLIRQLRYRTDEEYREKVDIEVNDERNKYIANQAWVWAGYLFVMIMAVVTIISKALGYDEVTTFASSSLCFLLVLYWISYLFLKRKY